MLPLCRPFCEGKDIGRQTRHFTDTQIDLLATVNGKLTFRGTKMRLTWTFVSYTRMTVMFRPVWPTLLDMQYSVSDHV